MPEQRKHSISIPTAPLPEPISQNIDAIVAMHTNAERSLSRHRRIVEAMTRFFSRPTFLYGTVLFVLLWAFVNMLPLGLPQFDPPPFNELDVAFGFASLVMTISVLIRQERQEKLAEQRAQLSLQLSLLSEQKIAKLIALIEELREDLPNVKNRYDPEAQMMQQAADPEQVLTALEETLAEELIEIQTSHSID
ncbi:DUF1003 domain-containing protein [Myxacorys almedinensis]|uniref:DUF1003 domain-containing protein n=1 Tax=Myxacorys almedinensis A TaxID=2690445 RepID=A0A8J8CN27_9CYAN|nr:DUF1003 domain-containing protein [Myxacorys almedinensis]NDJ17972.1 DUF1003 domain-containing protein [Myxacorys almedinensis A]